MSDNGYPNMVTTEGPVQVLRDGEPISPVLEGSDKAFAWLLLHQGQSVEWALRHEGYSVVLAEQEHPSDCLMCAAGEPQRHNYEQPQ